MKLHTRVKRTTEFRQMVASRPLSTREQLLMQLVLGVAEAALTEERVQHTETKGQLAVAEQQTKFALLIGSTGRLVGNGARFLVTPFSQMPDLYFRPYPPKRLAECTGLTMDVPYSLVDGADSDEVEPDEPPGGASPHLGMFISGLPKWLQACLLFARDRLAHLSPMTTAILFVLGITAAVIYGEHARAHLEHSYKLAQDDVKKYKVDAEQLPSLESELRQTKEQFAALEISERGLKDQNATLEVPVHGMPRKNLFEVMILE